ncbi:MAG TPA: hypothetical protein VGN63_11355 [Flavisolibacter sp.]|jgi:hypothetical protein|nr:hypothetical protein [Flavisolibacter sp.]
MKQLIIPVTLLLFMLVACETGTQPSPQPKEPVPEKIYTVADFTDTLAKQDTMAPGAIEKVLQIYNTMVPHDSIAADSAASALLQFINAVVTAKNDSLFQNPDAHHFPTDPAAGNLTEQQKATFSALHTNRLKVVQDGEGGIYLVPLYEMILPGIKDRTSDPVDTFLDLTAKEDTTPTFLDAGLAIEIEELADRLVISEQLLGQRLPDNFKSRATHLNRYYTRAFILGSDNSPSLEFNAIALNENFRNGYAYLLAKYPSTKAAASVKTWMATVASGDQKKIESFRKAFQ